ncbi:MAG: hypothetical protein AAGF11_21395 [Myxococcota bacterium]
MSLMLVAPITMAEGLRAGEVLQVSAMARRLAGAVGAGSSAVLWFACTVNRSLNDPMTTIFAWVETLAAVEGGQHTKVRIDKVRIDKVQIDKARIDKV